MSAAPHAERLVGQFLNGSGVRALAASDNCTCVSAVAGQADVCGAVDSVISGCSHCGCRLVDVFESFVAHQDSPTADLDLAAKAGTGDLTSAFERSTATIPSIFTSPALPYFCSRDGSHTELKDRTSKCRWTALHERYPSMHAEFAGAGREAKAVAASDDCSCAVMVLDQFGVCEAVDKAIKDCSNIRGNCSCRLVDVSPSTCLVPEPPPRERSWTQKRRQQQETFGTITYGSLWQQGEADILPEACPAGRYVVATDPCGLQHRNQGLGSVANTLKLQVEAAVRLNATFVYNPVSLCIDRNRAGYSLGELFSLRGAPCSAAALHQASRSAGWPVINVTLAPSGHHLPTYGGELDQYSEQWLEESVRTARAALDALPSGSPAVLNVMGCPWVRSWHASLMSSATGEFLRAPLRRGHENAQAWSAYLPAPQSDERGAERPVVCVHYRYGDMGALMKRLPEGAKVGGEAGQYYISNINETVAALRRAFNLVPSLAQARLMLFSEGMPTDPPFLEFKGAFPAAELVLSPVDIGGGTGTWASMYAPDKSTLRDLRFMAAADLLVVTCGTFSTLLTVLHFRGVTLQHPCTAQTLPRDSPAAVNFLDFAVEDGSFDEDAFVRMWDRTRSSRASRAVYRAQLEANASATR